MHVYHFVGWRDKYGAGRIFEEEEILMSSLKIGAFQFKATGNLQENIERYNLLKGHLQTRAVENVMTVIAVNSISQYQTAPTAFFDPSVMLFVRHPRIKRSCYYMTTLNRK